MSLKSSINFNLCKFNILQEVCYRILNEYLYAYSAYKKEDNEIDMGISDFSTYYFELRDRKILKRNELLCILKQFKNCINLLITELFNNLLNNDVLNYIKSYLY